MGEARGASEGAHALGPRSEGAFRGSVGLESLLGPDPVNEALSNKVLFERPCIECGRKTHWFYRCPRCWHGA